MAELPPVFRGVHFWVTDLSRTLTFYRELGMPIPAEAGSDPKEQFFNLALPGGQSFAFGTHELTSQYDPGFERPGSGKGAACLQFDVPTRAGVDDLYRKLEAAGYQGHLAPIDAFWGARYAEVRDPDGNVVGFHSPREARS